jgi:RimJ/RimL family protein N-acetyltransferase
MNATMAEWPLDVLARSEPPGALRALPLPQKIAALRSSRLRGISVVFQPYERAYGEQLRALRNQPNNKLNLAQSSDISAEQQRAWEDGYFARSDDLCWILLTTERVFAGAVALYDITADSAETGRLVVREEVARATPMIADCELMVQWLAFQWFGLRSVRAQIQPANTKMITMHERLGFRLLGPSSIRGVPYLQFEITADNFRPGPHEKVLRHWRNRAAPSLT